jgi:hypothetical protein
MGWLRATVSWVLALGMITSWATGHIQIAWVLAGVFMVITVVEWFAGHRAQRSEVLPDLSPEQIEELRTERDRAGEVAATKRLRELHPGLRLVSAATMIREL